LKPKMLSVVIPLLSASLSVAWAGNRTVAGRVSTPFPTLTNLAVEWLISGDDDLDATVEVAFRQAGQDNWRKALPLVRVPADCVPPEKSPVVYRWPNMFAGSLFDLRPATEYEIRLSLHDPDGGDTVQTVRARTRPVPRAAADSTVKKVNPVTFADSALTARPGDVLLLAPGYYGEFTMRRDGEPGRPIVIRSDRSHPLINSTFDSVSLEGRRHVILEGVTVNGPVSLRFAESCAVRGCTVNALYGIIAKPQPGCANCYIADNAVTGPMPWVAEGIGSSLVWGGGANEGEGIEITGPGNVVCFNRVLGYRDCISSMESLWPYDQRCFDIYNNDISVGADDGIEADFLSANCRIMRNRLTNCGMGLSGQPTLGGPVYFIRNVIYNVVICPFKLERHSVGNYFLHNTVVKVGDGFYEHHYQNEYFRTHFINNLTLGGTGAGRFGRYASSEGPAGLAVVLPGFNETCSFEYNAVGTVGTPFAGIIGRQRFGSLAELDRLTGGHNRQVGIEVFAGRVDFPDPAFPEREPADLRPAQGSAVVDAAKRLSDVNDDFTGAGPDIGAHEYGRPPEHYGPRPPGVDEETLWEERQKRIAKCYSLPEH